MNTRDQEPLTPEERELAQRLSRLDAQASPSAALDAKILAAARSPATATGADATPASAPARPRRSHWPVGLGIAASLLAAVGIAWQLRPAPDSHALPAMSEASAPQAASTEPASAALVTGAPTGDAPADVPEAVSDATGPAAATATEATAPAAVAAAQAPASSDAPPASPPSPLPAEPAAALEPAPAAAQVVRPRAHLPATGTPAAAPTAADAHRRSLAGQPAPDTQAPDIPATAPPPLDDQPLDVRPPASANSPDVREHWLQRIRELRDAGELDEARASLREFVRRHPRADVPVDLRPLLPGA